ncbi:3-deoxy-D-manno-octulosonate cytidylyltransferase [Chloroherpeton thalassium ATCC 35110]|uniref:3-deoxy-manno-octulosonate cytidylyltransferase n=1 Tax=Chloroherpeton thalassium (strain ATCC 35110 / GB-78) TaxID=517418 RepID=KDSB_CHLT3|nr:3-deoxy-manno-octulosonate cytidylyltransferase [Chloroherpeton thalassium]B3QTV9.1 RecName: Full=3-deoxy-manno-octulosonate cytidylyltransferase; AltName: Full=CMP-2-keto-3-deoxyoctulosonic acid synthase; Short=CKS; Short=CMP-KDO synthase [Chloroherpeton thalassium ATCC 35110]ACF14307.1 3-deoxy-D-manno-octulosonate cytidylyltransferase [Chloroherpeton thalassium ATCC 35110]
MKAVIVIPARLKSTRLPEKMLVDLDGKPLVVRTYEQAKKSRLASDVLLAVDSKRLLDIAESFGCKAVLTPENLQSGTDRIAFAAKSIDADVVINVQGDEPLIPPEMIDSAILPFIENAALPCATLIQPIVSDVPEILQNPNVVKVVTDKNGYALYFSRSPIPYQRNSDAQPKIFRHIGLYAFRKPALETFTTLPPSMLEETERLEQLRLLENGIRIKCVITNLDSQAVDTADDLAKVKAILAKKLK